MNARAVTGARPDPVRLAFFGLPEGCGDEPSVRGDPPIRSGPQRSVSEEPIPRRYDVGAWDYPWGRSEEVLSARVGVRTLLLFGRRDQGQGSSGARACSSTTLRRNNWVEYHRWSGSPGAVEALWLS